MYWPLRLSEMISNYGQITDQKSVIHVCRWDQVNICRRTTLFIYSISKQHVDKNRKIYLLESCKLLFSRVIFMKQNILMNCTGIHDFLVIAKIIQVCFHLQVYYSTRPQTSALAIIKRPCNNCLIICAYVCLNLLHSLHLNVLQEIGSLNSLSLIFWIKIWFEVEIGTKDVPW